MYNSRMCFKFIVIVHIIHSYTNQEHQIWFGIFSYNIQTCLEQLKTLYLPLHLDIQNEALYLKVR